MWYKAYWSRLFENNKLHLCQYARHTIIRKLYEENFN